MRGAVFPLLLALLAAMLLTPGAALANLAGGTAGSGPDVTVKDNGDGTVTLANGIVAIVIVKDRARLNSVTYTYNNGGAPKTTEVLRGKGQYYYGGFSLGSGVFTYTLATDPTKNGGNYADVMLLSDSEKNGVMEAHFSMLRGSPGYYSTGIMTHRPQDVAFEVGAWGVVTRVPPAFNWLSADAWRNFFIGARSSKGKGGAQFAARDHRAPGRRAAGGVRG